MIPRALSSRSFASAASRSSFVFCKDCMFSFFSLNSSSCCFRSIFASSNSFSTLSLLSTRSKLSLRATLSSEISSDTTLFISSSFKDNSLSNVLTFSFNSTIRISWVDSVSKASNFALSCKLSTSTSNISILFLYVLVPLLCSATIFSTFLDSVNNSSSFSRISRRNNSTSFCKFKISSSFSQSCNFKSSKQLINFFCSSSDCSN
mmetsp:Transcript_36994/g.55335  ORF Transcript_36994/g.55335 Transcript_36994/m.55335 type:complete len:205 (+) Transcript_36994:1212-1826(+)